MPQWHELYLPKVRLTEIDDVPLVSLETRSLPPGSLEVKRILDITIALVLVVLAFHLFCEEEHQDGVRHALAEMGIREMGFELDSDGAQVLVNDPFIDCDEKCGTGWIFSPVSAA